MIKLKYSYKTKITFSENIYRHHFLLRCTPALFDFQKITDEKSVISPSGTVTVGRDSFGNLIHNGYIGDFHNYFQFEATGIVEQTYYSIKEGTESIVSLSFQIHAANEEYSETA